MFPEDKGDESDDAEPRRGQLLVFCQRTGNSVKAPWKFVIMRLLRYYDCRLDSVQQQYLGERTLWAQGRARFKSTCCPRLSGRLRTLLNVIIWAMVNTPFMKLSSPWSRISKNPYIASWPDQGCPPKAVHGLQEHAPWRRPNLVGGVFTIAHFSLLGRQSGDDWNGKWSKSRALGTGHSFGDRSTFGTLRLKCRKQVHAKILTSKSFEFARTSTI